MATGYRSIWAVAPWSLALVLFPWVIEIAVAEGVVAPATPYMSNSTGSTPVPGGEQGTQGRLPVSEIKYQQPVVPRLEAPSIARLPPLAAPGSGSMGAIVPNRSGTSGFGVGDSTLPDINFASRGQAFLRANTDAGDLLGTLPSVTAMGVQRRNPIVTDPRVRGSRVGSLAAAGSYWVPARIDLDTMVSKIDSRIVDQIQVIPGPYSAIYGPGFNFVQFDLLEAPRYQHGFDLEGASSFDVRTNGQQWHGRQSISGGDQDWGFRGGYSQRSGSPYTSGDDSVVAAGYKSREFDFTTGADLTSDSTINVNFVRLDQTDIELPGQAFDIDWLVTDGIDVGYVLVDQPRFDRFMMETWYNRTRFEGSAQRATKHLQFPAYDDLAFVGNTDVDSMSTGYRALWEWNGSDDEKLIAGTDLRYVNQQLNEFSSGRLGFNFWDNQNSPIPASHNGNPGLFVEYAQQLDPDVTLATGGRLDWNRADIDASATDLANVGIVGRPAQDFLGTDQYSQTDLLGLGFLKSDLHLGDGWTLGSGVSYAERAPNLTERYAIESFMFLIQNGLNTVTGDPLLQKERMLQADIRLTHRSDRWTGTVQAYRSWVHDYITFEAMSVVPFPPNAQIEQVNLKYVNTDLATLWGIESMLEYRWTDHWVPFATLRYVEGEDETRNGSFATSQANATTPTFRDFTKVRGENSGVTGADKEPLPGILPLDGRLGIRWQDHPLRPYKGLELLARAVADQDRVATSLLESRTPGFTTWDLRGFFLPQEKVRLIAGLENLGNKQYREHLDFRYIQPVPGRGNPVFRPGISFYFGAETWY